MNDNVIELKNLKRVTQKEIAKRLGISRTTVARAINGSEFIKEETKSKILELASELNYEKNYIGSSLANQKEKTVHCLIANSFNEFYTKEIVRGLNTIQKEYSIYNYNLKITPTEIHSPDKQVEILKNILEEGNIDGLIITPLNREVIYNILKPYFGKINIISIGTRLSENIPHVGPNHIKQGSIVAGIVSNLLRDNEKLLICNEEGKLNGMQGNRRIGNDVIAGPFFIVGEDGDEFRSLTDEEVKASLKRFAEPEEISQEEVENAMSAGVMFFG